MRWLREIDDPRGRLARLIKYTDGQPKEMIKRCIQQPAAAGYKNARSLLEEQYGNPHQILAAYRKEIKSWPQLKPADGTAYMKLYNFLLKCEIATLGQNWNVLDGPEMMCLMLSKLPGNTREKWSSSLMNIRRRHLRELDFTDIIHFVDDEATLADDLLFSKEALSGYVDKNEAANRRKQLKTYLTAAEEKTEEIVNACQLCHKSHDLDSCPEYKKNSVEERSKFLFQKELCYGCYTPISSEHNARICKRRRVCDICGERHPTGLHGYKARKKNRTGDGNDSGKNNGFLACATTKMKSNVVSMCVVPVKVKCNKSRKELKTYVMLDCCSQGTFINSELAKKLRTEGTLKTIKIKTLNGEESQETEAISDLKVTSSNGKNVWIDLPVSHTRENLPIRDKDIATLDKIKD